jgi:hypothetical protein
MSKSMDDIEIQFLKALQLAEPQQSDYLSEGIITEAPKTS